MAMLIDMDTASSNVSSLEPWLVCMYCNLVIQVYG